MPGPCLAGHLGRARLHLGHLGPWGLGDVCHLGVRRSLGVCHLALGGYRMAALSLLDAGHSLAVYRPGVDDFRMVALNLLGVGRNLAVYHQGEVGFHMAVLSLLALGGHLGPAWAAGLGPVCRLRPAAWGGVLPLGAVLPVPGLDCQRRLREWGIVHLLALARFVPLGVLCLVTLALPALPNLLGAFGNLRLLRGAALAALRLDQLVTERACHPRLLGVALVAFRLGLHVAKACRLRQRGVA